MKLDPMLQRAVDAGLMTEAHAASVDAWAEELAKEFTAGRITEAERDRRMLERLMADLSRRGQS